MAAEYNRIPSGSLVSVFSHTGKCIAQASLLEDFVISINSEFGHVIESGDSMVEQNLNCLAGALKSASHGSISGSTAFKQMGALVWRKTDNF